MKNDENDSGGLRSHVILGFEAFRPIRIPYRLPKVAATNDPTAHRIQREKLWIIPSYHNPSLAVNPVFRKKGGSPQKNAWLSALKLV